MKNSGFPQTSLEKFQWLFNDISRQKFPNFHDNSERHKTENHRTTCFAWPPYTPYVYYWVLLRKLVKVFLFHLMNSVSANNTCKINIYLPRWLVKTTSISEFNDFSMSDWSKIQWCFHDFVILTNFKKFSWNSMIFQWSWSRSEFQWFFKSCGNPEDVVGASATGDASTTSEWSTISLPTKVRFVSTHCGLVTPYGDIELGQHWLR